jgi:hypothetical protein
MAKYHQIEGIKGSDLTALFGSSAKSTKAASKSGLNFPINQPDILPEDMDKYNEVISKYLDEATGIATKIQGDSSYDYKADIVKVRNGIMKEFNSGIVAEMKKRKRDHDIYSEAAKKARTPQEYAEAVKNIIIEPIETEDGRIGRVYSKDFYSGTDDKNVDTKINQFKNSIKPDQFLTSWMASDSFDASKMDEYSKEKIKQVTYDEAEKLIGGYIGALDETKRYDEIHPENKFRNEDGSYNTNNPFVSKLFAAAGTAAHTQVDAVHKAYMDPAYRSQLMRTREAIKQQAKSEEPTFIPPLVESAFEGKSIKTKEVDPFYSKKLIGAGGKNIPAWDPKDLQDIADRLSGHVAKNGGSIYPVTAHDLKAFKELKHDNYLHIELADKSDRFIDMTKPIDEVKKKLIEILTGMSSGGTNMQARTIEN